MLDSLKTVLHAGKMPECFGVVKSTSRFFRRPPSVNSPESCRKVLRPPEVSVPPKKQRLLASKRCFLGGTDTSGGLKTLRQLSGLLTDGGRRKKRDVDFTTPKHSGILPAWSTVFRESSIELGSVAPFSVVNPEDAVQIIGGRPVIGSERIRRHARRKVREPRPPQRLSFFPS